ncbi:nitroreductase family protein [uncultured Intestinimonas sp.]|uniref:nitroreductase family protein n=1 Tax=uncultured Intestinimonas sp. TaxID=1689265 RepID=UPI0025DDA53F|nr:nitroreductase family protein [uncultured Intestinimonas sp.]
MENKAYETILGRRSIRAFQPRQVEQQELDAVLQAGLYAPCGMGSQLVTLVAVQDPAVRGKLSAMNAAIMGTNSDPYYGAPTIVVVLASPERYTWVEDGSCALTVMMEAAHALGLGSCWIHRAREMFDSDEGKALLKEWGVPACMRGVGTLALGYPAGAAPTAPARKPGRVFKI